MNGNGLLNYDNVNYPAAAVRPACFLNLESLIFKSVSNDFDLGSNPAGAAGSPENPYVLIIKDNPVSLDQANVSYASADKLPNGAAINGKNMTVSWDVPISPAVKHWPASGDFTLSVDGVTQHPTNVTSDDTNPKLLKLTFATGVVASDTNVKLSYNLNTDAISCDVNLGTASVVNSFSDIIVTNTTSSGGGGGGNNASNETTPTGVGVTLADKTYPAQIQPDGTYLIALPSGTDLKNIRLAMTLPTGATVSPNLSAPYDFTSENPKKFTITAQNGKSTRVITIEITTETPSTEKTIVSATASDCAVTYTRTENNKIAVEIRIPFATGITPSALEKLSASFKTSGFSDITLAYVNADGTIVPYSAPSTHPNASVKAPPYVQIKGTAISVASLATEALTHLHFGIKDDATRYVQTFANGGLKLSEMNITDNTQETSGSSGCNAGASGAGLSLALAVMAMGITKIKTGKKK